MSDLPIDGVAEPLGWDVAFLGAGGALVEVGAVMLRPRSQRR
jgi:hypothetical protein